MTFGALTHMNGYRLKINDAVCITTELKQVKFPRRKNRRIQSRWKNNKANWGKITSHKAFFMDNILFVSTETWIELQKGAANANNKDRMV